jgi:hypothetical protein
MENVNAAAGKNFLDATGESPCTGCSAPCCRLLLVNHPAPTTFMDLDYIRYMVGFQGVEMILTRAGEWKILIEQPCGLLDQETCRCTVHNTSRKPKTCVFFNPYNCWYKRNFHNTEYPPDLVRIDPQGLEAMLAHVRFDDNCRISGIPPWELVRDLVRSAEVRQPQNSSVQLTQISGGQHQNNGSPASRLT